MTFSTLFCAKTPAAALHADAARLGAADRAAADRERDDVGKIDQPLFARDIGVAAVENEGFKGYFAGHGRGEQRAGSGELQDSAAGRSDEDRAVGQIEAG